KLILINSVPIRLREQASQFIHVRPGSESAAVLALAGSGDDDLAARKTGVEASELDLARRTITQTSGDVVVMFGSELGPQAQTIVAQMPYTLAGEGRRVLLHPLPLFNNSVGALDMGMHGKNLPELFDATGGSIRAMYIAGSFLPEHLENRADALGRLDFLVVQELFETETTAFADVVFPAASFAEVDGTYTNNDGL